MNSGSIQIGDRHIGEGHPCVVIAEAGSAHQGELSRAYELIDAAADAYLDRQDQLDVHGATNTLVRLGGCAVVQLEAGQDLDLRAYQNSGGALALQADADLCYLCIWAL